MSAVRLLKNRVSGRDPALRGFCKCSPISKYAVRSKTPRARAEGLILVFQHPAKALIVVLAMILLALSAGDLSAWDPQWQFRQEARSNQPGTGITSIEMQKKYDHDPMKRFKGTTDVSNGQTILRNLNGEIMRGYIDKDGFGLLRDQDGNLHRVNTR